MKFPRYLWPVLISAVVAAAGVPALAADDDDAAITTGLLSTISNTFNIPTNTAGTKSFLVLQYPGQFIPDDLAPIDYAEDDLVIATYLNTVPSPSWISSPTTSIVWNEYNRILTEGKTKPRSLTKAEEVDLEKAYRFLVDENDPELMTTVYKNYLKYADEYYYALAELQAQQEEVNIKERKTVDATVRRAAQTAMDKWNSLGKKAEVEKNIEKMRQLNSKDPSVFWYRLRENFAKSMTTAGIVDYYKTYTLPAYSSWYTDQGWVKISMSSSQLSKVKKSTNVDVGIKVDYEWGALFSKGSVSTNNQVNVDWKSESMKSKDFNLEFEVKRVSIIRPWLDSSLFYSDDWKFDDNTVISDGKNLTKGSGPSGSMPLIPTGFLLARNVKVTGITDESDLTSLKTAVDSNTNVRWACFSAKGNVNVNVKTRTEDTTSNVKILKGGFEITEPQIIGYFCEIVPLSPKWK